MNEVRLWDWIVLDGSRFQVVAVDGAIVELEDARTMRRERLPTTELVSMASVTARQAALGGVAALARVSASERERCERIARVITAAEEQGGSIADIVARTRAALAHGGQLVSERQVRRYRAAFHANGVAGLLDHRRDGTGRAPRVDPRVVGLLEVELDRQRDASTGTRSRVLRRLEWKAKELELDLPSRSTMYRLIAELDRGRSSFGPATTRRSKALRPDRTFRRPPVTRPGELVEIDSTPLDVVALLPDGSRCRPELTYAIDVATSTIVGTLLRGSPTKSVDVGALLLARMLTPLLRRPGWPAMRDHARTLLGSELLPTDQEWDDLAATMPLIVPEAVTVDRGKVFTGSTFSAACERQEISQIIANPRQPTDKPHVEGGFRRIRDGFVQYLAGFTGGSVADRGTTPESEAIWTVEELQILLDLWVLTSWQATPQNGLRLPDIPRRTLSPNQMYQALTVAAPQISVGLAEADYIALMPMEWRTIQPYGINLHALTYDDEALHPFRGRSSGLSGTARGRWEVRYDPHDLRQVWVRDHQADTWITANWTLAAMSDQPLSRDVLRAARASLETGTSGPPASLDVLREINRLQEERARKKKLPAVTAPPPPAVLTLVTDDPNEGHDADEGFPTSPARLRILE